MTEQELEEYLAEYIFKKEIFSNAVRCGWLKFKDVSTDTREYYLGQSKNIILAVRANSHSTQCFGGLK